MKKMAVFLKCNGGRIIILALLGLWAQVGFAQDAKSYSYKTYWNSDYGYKITYPDKVLKPEPESFGGDGRWFDDKKGKQILQVYGTHNLDPETSEDIPLKKQYAIELKNYKSRPGLNITYTTLGKSLYIISGTEKGKVFYQKTILRPEGYAYASLNYDTRERAVYDTVSGVIFKSFK